MKLIRERDMRFVNNVNTTISNEQMTKIKVLDLQKLYNLVLENLLI
jgi:hypothetical protein